jgi:hypothetical protein
MIPPPTGFQLCAEISSVLSPATQSRECLLSAFSQDPWPCSAVPSPLLPSSYYYFKQVKIAQL